MDEACAIAAIQQHLTDLGKVRGNSPAEPMVRAVLARAVEELRFLCAVMLRRSYPRLMRAPLNLDADELLSSVVKRLLNSLHKVRPTTVRQFFALANQHMRWELNDLARELDLRDLEVELTDESIAAPDSDCSEISLNGLRMLQAIENLPEEEGEVFDLIRLQGMTQSEVAKHLEVSTKTVQRRLNRGLLRLAESLTDLRPSERVSNLVHGFRS